MTEREKAPPGAYEVEQMHRDMMVAENLGWPEAWKRLRAENQVLSDMLKKADCQLTEWEGQLSEAKAESERLEVVKAENERLKTAEEYWKDRFLVFSRANNDLSKAYIRLRQILGTINIPPMTTEEMWKVTENRAEALQQQLAEARGEVADLLPRMDADALTMRLLVRERDKAIVEARETQAKADQAIAEAAELRRVLEILSEVRRAIST